MSPPLISTSKYFIFEAFHRTFLLTHVFALVFLDIFVGQATTPNQSSPLDVPQVNLDITIPFQLAR
ncbi:hypothetical protein ACTXT7_014129 [Hymenolepis weldensis]